MIGRLQGHIVQKQPPHLLLDVQGVGYELQAPMSTFYNLPPDDQTVALYIHMVVREDAQLLYGFLDLSERTLFRHLLKINGVGGKVALAILSGMSTAEFEQAIQAGSTTALTCLPGIGKKTAERLIVEMKDRLPKTGTPVSADNTTTPSTTDALDDALGALLALGYKPAEAQRMLNKVTATGLTTEDIIRQALQNMRV